VIALNWVIGIPLGDMARGGQKLIQCSYIGRRAVGTHLTRLWTMLERAGEKPASSRQIPLVGPQQIDDLPILVDRPIPIPPPPGDFHIHLIHKPVMALFRRYGNGGKNARHLDTTSKAL
jgi:hypothetical protein